MGNKIDWNANLRVAGNDNHDLLGLKSALRSKLIAHGLDPVKDPFSERMESLADLIRDLALSDLAREVGAGREIGSTFLDSWRAFFVEALAYKVTEEAARRSRPPRAARLLLLATVGEVQKEAVLGDVMEVFSKNVKARGVRFARRALWEDVLRSIPALAVHRVRRLVALLLANERWTKE